MRILIRSTHTSALPLSIYRARTPKMRFLTIYLSSVFIKMPMRFVLIVIKAFLERGIIHRPA